MFMMPAIRTWRGWVVLALAAIVVVGGGIVMAGSLISASPSQSQAIAQAENRGFTNHGEPQAQGAFQWKTPVTFGRCTGTLVTGSNNYAKLETQVVTGVTIKSVTVDNPTLAGLNENPTFERCFS